MSEYEFSDTENQSFLNFSKRLFYLSIALLFTGVITIIKGSIRPTNGGDIIVGLVFMIMALALFVPVQYFRKIISSVGNDMEHFVRGFNMLGSGMIVVIAGMGIILITIIGGIF